MTEAEFLTLPETQERVELIDGEVVVAPSPSFWHQDVLLRLAVVLRQWSAAASAPFEVCLAPLDVRFGPDRILQPDLFVLQGHLPRAHTGPIERVPIVCVEVLSSNRSYDRITKRFIYAQAGVAEYWIVSAAEVIERWTGDGLEHVEEVHDRLTTPVLPQLVLDVPSLFATPP